MMKIERAVVDTNILISGPLQAFGNGRWRFFDGHIQIIVFQKIWHSVSRETGHLLAGTDRVECSGIPMSLSRQSTPEQDDPPGMTDCRVLLPYGNRC